MSSHKKYSLPPRWLNCPRKSEGLIINKFLVIKTPLSSNFDDVVPPHCRFTPDMVFKIAKSKKVTKLSKHAIVFKVILIFVTMPLFFKSQIR